MPGGSQMVILAECHEITISFLLGMCVPHAPLWASCEMISVVLGPTFIKVMWRFLLYFFSPVTFLPFLLFKFSLFTFTLLASSFLGTESSKTLLLPLRGYLQASIFLQCLHFQVLGISFISHRFVLLYGSFPNSWVVLLHPPLSLGSTYCIWVSCCSNMADNVIVLTSDSSSESNDIELLESFARGL
jgi:hypothetical protein